MTSFRSNLSALASAQKSSKGVSLYSRYLNRPMGRVLAAAAHDRGLSPNQVTVVSGVLSAAGLLVIATAPPSAFIGIIVAALLVAGFACDSADGQVARLSGTSSPAGEWLDHVVDSAKMVGLHAAILIGWFRFTPFETPWLLVPLAFQMVAVVMFSALTITALLKRAESRGGTTSPQPPSVTRAIALLPADYGVLALSLVLWGAPDVFRVAYVLLLTANAAVLVAFLVKWYRELRRLGTPPPARSR